MLSPRSACIPRLFAENNQVYQVCSSCAGIQSNCNQNSVYVLVRICSDTLWGRVGERLLSLRPIASVKTAVAYGFGYVVHLDVLLAFQVGDGACHLEYAAVGTCRELQAFHGPSELFGSLGGGCGVLLQHLLRHLCIAVYAGTIFETVLLNLPRRYYTFADFLARFAYGRIAKVFDGHRYDINLEVYSV